MEQLKLSYVAGGNAKLYSSLENSLVISYKDKYTLIIHSAILLPNIYLSELKISVHTKICMQMFTAA